MQECLPLLTECIGVRVAARGEFYVGIAAPLLRRGEALLLMRHWLKASVVLSQVESLVGIGADLLARALFLSSCALAQLGEAEASRMFMHRSAKVRAPVSLPQCFCFQN